MRAERYRLRFFTGATLTASTYGGGNYGDQIYGTIQSDSLTTAHHRLVPWPGGNPTQPSWVYRQHDTKPALEAVIVADDGVTSYVGLESAVLVLTPIDDPVAYKSFTMTVVTQPNGDQRLHRDWQLTDLDRVGAFRCAVMLNYTSGRHLTVPANDEHMMIVTTDGS